MNIKPIKSEANYESALEAIARLMDAEPGTPKGDRLDVLTTLVEAHERKAHPIESPDHDPATESYNWYSSGSADTAIRNRKRRAGLRPTHGKTRPGTRPLARRRP